MKIYINHAYADKALAEKIKSEILNSGYEVLLSKYTRIVLPGEENKSKETFIRRNSVDNYDVALNLLTNSFFKSKSTVKELNEILLKSKKTISVAVDDVFVPEYLSSFVYFRLRDDSESSVKIVIEGLLRSFQSDVTKNQIKEENYQFNKNEVIDKMKESLESGNLTLVCGAGVSLDAGIPIWGDLLNNLFSEMLNVMRKEGDDFDFDSNTVKDSGISNSVSSLILAKYIKNNLKGKFSDSLRTALYKGSPTTSELISAIVDLARPRRDGKSIDSIITFNFDGLIEEQLEKERIEFKAISSESIKCTSNELAIYHVHGYLPREISEELTNGIVFSEDSYHSQFIEPFSWSNIVQLQKLTQNTCLFIGVSLTDPNLRRLLDVAWRKNPESVLAHYIIKKKPNLSYSDVGKFTMYLEEQDANELGLNVIWVDEYKDIPILLRTFLD